MTVSFFFLHFYFLHFYCIGSQVLLKAHFSFSKKNLEKHPSKSMKEQQSCDTAEWTFPVSQTGSFPRPPIQSEPAVYHLTSQVFIKVTTSAMIKDWHTACRHRA